MSEAVYGPKSHSDVGKDYFKTCVAQPDDSKRLQASG